MCVEQNRSRYRTWVRKRARYWAQWQLALAMLTVLFCAPIYAGFPALFLNQVADQTEVQPGQTLSTQFQLRNQGGTSSTRTLIVTPIPEKTVFLGALLPTNSVGLLCIQPPADQFLPPGLSGSLFFSASQIVNTFVPGQLVGDQWQCASGELTTWVAAWMDDPALLPAAFMPGPTMSWQLLLRNDEARDEPNSVQQNSSVGAVIQSRAAIVADGLLPAISPMRTTTVAVPPETVGFERCRIQVQEGGTLDIPVLRLSGGATVVSVDFSALAGSALPGVDYIAPAAQTLTWAVGDLTSRILHIQFPDDAVTEVTKHFRLQLTNATGALLSANALVDIEILDASSLIQFQSGFEGEACAP